MVSAWQEASVLVLWASETGAGEDIAKQIAARARDTHMIDATAVSMADVAAQGPSLIHTLNGTATGEQRRALLFVASSTGAGEPPENSVKFMTLLRRARRKLKAPSPSGPSLAPPAALLGLGDSNYTDYQANPRTLATLLADVGAVFFYARGEADEATGLEDDVEQWIEGLWEPLKAALEKSVTEESHTSPLGERHGEGEGRGRKEEAVKRERSKKKPSKFAGRIRKRKTVATELLWSLYTVVTPEDDTPSLSSHTELPSYSVREGLTPITVVGARWLTAPDAVKQALEVRLDLSRMVDSNRLPGDAVGIYCPNALAEVDSVLEYLGLDGEQRIGVDIPSGGEQPPSHVAALQDTTVREFLSWGVDLRGIVKKASLKALSECAADPDEKAKLLFLSSPEGKQPYRNEFEVGRPGLVEVLQRFPSCAVDLGTIARLWPRAQPRYYSYASDPSSDSHVRVVFSLVTYSDSNGALKKGLCTHWLAERCVEHGFIEAREGLGESTAINECPLVISGFHKASTAFRMATDEETLARPFVMVGPGTGVAPFLSFLEKRQQLSRSSPTTAMGVTWLFFGCRSPDKDELYKDELDAFLEFGVLARRTVAYSRKDPDHVVYVQHKLEEHGSELVDLLLKQKARLFVCGDAKGMAVAVHTSLVTILSEHGGLSSQDAMLTKTRLLVERQLVFDVWF